ncbi:hypothetical protein [Crocinitomix catalasitica]|uniref:hypothetical protein n=1 Tax=Crocinitomix catalasitica TaxID=184607 RepID=UPI0004851E8F|nr:hypothetical protein [Crocinitomix catalasitica]
MMGIKKWIISNLNQLGLNKKGIKSNLYNRASAFFDISLPTDEPQKLRAYKNRTGIGEGKDRKRSKLIMIKENRSKNRQNKAVNYYKPTGS